MERKKFERQKDKPILVELSVHDPQTALYYLRRELEKRLDLRWQIADGKFMKVSDMTTAHLRNTIAILEQDIQLREI